MEEDENCKEHHATQLPVQPCPVEVGTGGPCLGFRELEGALKTFALCAHTLLLEAKNGFSKGSEQSHSRTGFRWCIVASLCHCLIREGLRGTPRL